MNNRLEGKVAVITGGTLANFVEKHENKFRY